MRSRSESLRSQTDSLDTAEISHSLDPNILVQLARHCQEVTNDIETRINPLEGDIDYNALVAPAKDLVDTVSLVHEINPQAVDYESWMLLLCLPDVMRKQHSLKNRAIRRKVWGAARKTADGREIVANDPEMKKILKSRRPAPYSQILARNFNSNPTYANQTLDGDYRKPKPEPQATCSHAQPCNVCLQTALLVA